MNRSKSMSDWTVRPGWGGGGGAAVSGTLGQYIVETPNDRFSVYFGGLGAGPSVGLKWSGGGAIESMPSVGSPLYWSLLAPRSLVFSRRSHWSLSGPGAIVEGGGAAVVGAGMQLLLFGWKGGVEPTAFMQAIGDCLIATYGGWFTSAWADAFAIVGGVSVGGVSIGATAYSGVFV